MSTVETENASLANALNNKLLHYLIPSLVLEFSLLLVGTAGNVLVIHNYYHYFKRTTTWYLIFTLALYDLFVCAVIQPMGIWRTFNNWVFTNLALCRVYRVLEISGILGSLWILGNIAVDSYIRVCHPFYHIKRRTSIIVCALSLLFTIPYNLPFAFTFYGIYRTNTSTPGVYTHECSWPNGFEGSTVEAIFHGLISLMFVALLLCFLICYGLIFKKLRGKMTTAMAQTKGFHALQGARTSLVANPPSSSTVGATEDSATEGTLLSRPSSTPVIRTESPEHPPEVIMTGSTAESRTTPAINSFGQISQSYPSFGTTCSANPAAAFATRSEDTGLDKLMTDNISQHVQGGEDKVSECQNCPSVLFIPFEIDRSGRHPSVCSEQKGNCSASGPNPNDGCKMCGGQNCPVYVCSPNRKHQSKTCSKQMQHITGFNAGHEDRSANANPTSPEGLSLSSSFPEGKNGKPQPKASKSKLRKMSAETSKTCKDNPETPLEAEFPAPNQNLVHGPSTDRLDLNRADRTSNTVEPVERGTLKYVCGPSESAQQEADTDNSVAGKLSSLSKDTISEGLDNDNGVAGKRSPFGTSGVISEDEKSKPSTKATALLEPPPPPTQGNSSSCYSIFSFPALYRHELGESNKLKTSKSLKPESHKRSLYILERTSLTMFVVCMTFVVCYLPSVIVLQAGLLNTGNLPLYAVGSFITRASMLQNAVRPAIYFVFNSRFRGCVESQFCPWKKSKFVHTGTL